MYLNVYDGDSYLKLFVVCAHDCDRGAKASPPHRARPLRSLDGLAGESNAALTADRVNPIGRRILIRPSVIESKHR